MNKDNLPYVFSVVYCVCVAFSVAWNWSADLYIINVQIRWPAAAERLLNLAHFLSLPRVPRHSASEKSKPDSLRRSTQKWSTLLASNDLKWRREFSHAFKIVIVIGYLDQSGRSLRPYKIRINDNQPTRVTGTFRCFRHGRSWHTTW